jgi:microcystin-dependent protein
MSRNGSGVYTKVNTFVSGNPVTAAGHNQNWDDLATEMTNSVAADGQTSMTGPLKAASGTVGAPGITFASDPDSGLYRIGSNNVGLAVNGAKVLDVATTGLDVTGTINSSGAVKQAGFSLLPVGVTLPYAGTSAPSGYLFCFGQSLLRTDYAALFTAIGTTYGAADGTHFTLPDLRGRAIAGKDDMGGSSANRLTNADDGLNGDTLGATGGGETQTLATANLPAYTPAGTNATSSVALTFASANSYNTTGASTAVSNITAGTGLGTDRTLTAAAQTFLGTAQGGTSTAFGIVQPTLILNYIIFAGI